MPGHKARFVEFCQDYYVPFQFQPWWLDAVCAPGGWELCLAFDGSGRVTGALPYHVGRRWGLPVALQPPFTTYSGPWLHYPDNPAFKQTSRYAFEKKTCAELIGQLPRLAFFRQNFLPDVTNWLPFYWAGFRQTTRYTYRIEAGADLQALRAGMENTLRTDLKKAHAATAIHPENDPDLLFRLNARSFERQGKRSPYNYNVFCRLYAALQSRGQGLGLVARDRNSGAPHAGILLAFDAQRASVLLSGQEPRFKTSGAVYGLLEAAVLFCHERRLCLDFEGSMEAGIERTFRAFGAQLTPYFQVWKAGNRLLEIADLLRR